MNGRRPIRAAAGYNAAALNDFVWLRGLLRLLR
jgi:hypothetical protein